MKKYYEAPEILFEDFALSSSISAGCEFKTSTMSEGDCGYKSHGVVVFTSDVSGCKYTEPDNNDSLCSHVPNEYANIFNS